MKEARHRSYTLCNSIYIKYQNRQNRSILSGARKVFLLGKGQQLQGNLCDVVNFLSLDLGTDCKTNSLCGNFSGSTHMTCVFSCRNHLLPQNFKQLKGEYRQLQSQSAWNQIPAFHLTATEPGENLLIQLGLNFLKCKMGIAKMSASEMAVGTLEVVVK